MATGRAEVRTSAWKERTGSGGQMTGLPVCQNGNLKYCGELRSGQGQTRAAPQRPKSLRGKYLRTQPRISAKNPVAVPTTSILQLRRTGI